MWRTVWKPVVWHWLIVWNHRWRHFAWKCWLSHSGRQSPFCFYLIFARAFFLLMEARLLYGWSPLQMRSAPLHLIVGVFRSSTFCGSVLRWLLLGVIWNKGVRQTVSFRNQGSPSDFVENRWNEMLDASWSIGKVWIKFAVHVKLQQFSNAVNNSFI